ncbi:hypothetical protein C8J56DRAFT_954594 [Mycena floridula]|nr:hypothetical protein C8J56DRAFT_954594 [Mycena floridula]
MSVLTRRAFLSEKSILHILPNEISTEIISFCDVTRKAVLCRVSKLFKQLAQPQLYQIVLGLGDAESIVSFAGALSANPEYATWVRELEIELDSEDKRFDREPLNHILQRTTELRRLTLGWLSEMPDFEQLRFPHLRVLHLFGELQNQTLATTFINRHPQLVHLTAYYADNNRSKTTSQINLPNLITYRGGTLLSMLGSVPKLRALQTIIIASSSLNHLSRYLGVQDLVIAVPHLTPQTARDIFEHLKNNFPHLKSFLLNSMQSIDLQVVNTEGILCEGLSDLKKLEFFGLLRQEVDLSAEVYRDGMIKLWVKSCPSLKECLWAVQKDYHSHRLAYKCKIINGEAQPTRERCRIELVFPTSFGF